MRTEELRSLINEFGQRYSETLGIDLSEGRESEVFKWFLASLLFGAPIRESSAIRAYRTFEKYNVLTPERILNTGWDGLVKILDEGSYARYDFKTADKLLEAMQNLKRNYNSSLKKVYESASDSSDLEARLKGLAKGIGDVTVSIFLRELRDVWEKADSKPTYLVILAAQDLNIVRKNATPAEVLVRLKRFWQTNAIPRKSFTDFETALFRYGKECRHKSTYTTPD